MPSSRQAVAAAVDDVLRDEEAVRVRDVVRRTGLSRHTVHRRLKDLVEDGLLRLVGKGRGARYVSVHRLPRNEAASRDDLPDDIPRVFLGATAEDLVSRAQARDLLRGHEGAEMLLLDFHGVARVGLGFADEVFRVWAGENPSTRLLPEHTSPAVELAIEQARQSAPVLPAAPQRALPPAPVPTLLTLSAGWTARVLELSRREGRVLLDLVAPRGGARLRFLLAGCQEIRLPAQWTLASPRLEPLSGGELVLADDPSQARVVFRELHLGTRLNDS